MLTFRTFPKDAFWEKCTKKKQLLPLLFSQLCCLVWALKRSGKKSGSLRRQPFKIPVNSLRIFDFEMWLHVVNPWLQAILIQPAGDAHPAPIPIHKSLKTFLGSSSPCFASNMTQLHSRVCSVQVVLIIVHIPIWLYVTPPTFTAMAVFKEIPPHPVVYSLLRPVCNYSAEHGYFIVLIVLDVKAQNATNIWKGRQYGKCTKPTGSNSLSHSPLGRSTLVRQRKFRKMIAIEIINIIMTKQFDINLT